MDRRGTMWKNHPVTAIRQACIGVSVTSAHCLISDDQSNPYRRLQKSSNFYTAFRHMSELYLCYRWDCHHRWDPLWLKEMVFFHFFRQCFFQQNCRQLLHTYRQTERQTERQTHLRGAGTAIERAGERQRNRSIERHACRQVTVILRTRQ